MKNKSIKIAWSLLLSSNFFLTAPDQNNYVTEKHEIYSIENGEVRGQNIYGTGEGIFYTVDQLEKEGLSNIRPGDIVEFKWTKENFNNSEWDQFDAKKTGSKQYQFLDEI